MRHAPLLLLIVPTLAAAGEPIPTWLSTASEHPTVPERRDAPAVPAQAAELVVRATHAARHHDGAALPDDVELLPTAILPWAAGTRVRLTPRSHGVPWDGEDRLVSFDSQGRLRRVRAESLPETSAIEPALSPTDAGQRFSLGLTPLTGRHLSLTAATLVWRRAHDGSAHLCWRVDVGAGTPGNSFRGWVDAVTGQVVAGEPTSRTAQARIYPQNPEVSELTEVELQDLDGDGDQLRGDDADVYSCDQWEGGGFGGGSCEAKSRHAAPDGNGDYLYDPDPTSSVDPMAEVMMYHHLDLVSRWFVDVTGFFHTQPLRGIVNFDYNNAFFGDGDGDGVADVSFGQGGGIDYAYDADVIYHEFGHSVIGRVAETTFSGADEYGLEFANGSLNEGSADVFSLAITLDPQLGDYAGTGGMGAGAIRDLEADRRCPNDLYGESHKDGEVWGAMGWNLIDDARVGPDLLSQVVYGAASTWDADVNWEAAGQSVEEVVDDMLDDGDITEEQREVILAEGRGSGVIGCGRVADLGDGSTPTLFMLNAGLDGDAEEVPLSLQFKLSVPEGADRLRFRIDELRTSSPELGWVLFMRRGAHIEHEVVTLPFLGLPFPVPTEYDERWEGEGDEFELVLDAESDPAIEPGEDYYFSIASRNLGGIDAFEFVTGEITVSGDVRAPEATPPADDGGGDEDGAGCGECSEAGARSSAASVWAAALLGLTALRRRRA